MGFHNLRQAEAAIRLWIKTAKEDGLENLPTSRALGLCVIATRHSARGLPSAFCLPLSASRLPPCVNPPEPSPTLKVVASPIPRGSMPENLPDE
jgi:hypothetical protein